MSYSSKYTYELWTKNGTRLADLTGIAQDRSIVLSRNNAEDLQFSLDVNKFENYCTKLGIDPKNILITNSVELRVKRLGAYFVGGQLVYKSTILSDTANKISCHVFGWLALFNKRFTGQTTAGQVLEVHTDDYGTAKSRKDLLWYLISASQALTNGDFGITRGLTGGSTTPYDKTYSTTNIMNAIQDASKLQTAPIDFWFTYDKTFNTATQQGSNRPEIIFEYPGNILSIEVPEDATDMTNEVIGIAAGGADGSQVRYFAEDTASQASYGLRQDIFQSNATDNSDNGLTDGANAALVAKSNPIKIPAIVVNGNIAPFVTDYGLGDRVMVKVNDHPTLSDINGMYRIEKITIDIDNDDNETITLQVSA